MSNFMSNFIKSIKHRFLRLFYDDDVLEATSSDGFNVTKSGTATSKFEEFWLSEKSKDNLDKVLNQSKDSNSN